MIGAIAVLVLLASGHPALAVGVIVIAVLGVIVK